MSDSIVAPVRGVIERFHKGIDKTEKICNAASEGSSASKMLQTVESARALQKSLADSKSQVNHAYAQGLNAFGVAYAQSILDDGDLTNKLQALTINLHDQLAPLSEYFEDREHFDPRLFHTIQRGSEGCCGQAIHLLEAVHRNLLGDGLNRFELPTRDDRAGLSSQRPVAARNLSEVSPMQGIPTHGFPAPSARDEPRAVRISVSSRDTADIPNAQDIQMGTSYGGGGGQGEAGVSGPKALSGSPGESTAKLINRADVVRQMSSNEEFLEKRKRTKASFDQEMENLRRPTNSTSASPRAGFAQASPRLLFASDIVASPIQTQRLDSSLLMARSPSREGQSTLSPTRRSPHSSPRSSPRDSPRNSAAFPFPNSPDSNRKDSAYSDLMVSGRPESFPWDSGRESAIRPDGSAVWAMASPGSPPTPLSSGRQSAIDGLGALSSTLKLPGFGDGVEHEKEVVGQLVSDPGLMLADENGDRQLTPPASVKLIEHPLTHGASFYKYGGFCKGANMLLQGVERALVAQKKQGAHLHAEISMKCSRCRYEIGFNVWDKDNFLDKAGIYSVSDIRFRHRFLSKCHLPAKHTEDPAYACIFCIEEGKTVDEDDATVFFSVSNLLRHLLKHSRPLKPVAGVGVLYGDQPDALDFDINFVTMEPQCSPFAGLANHFKIHAKAHAIANHREPGKAFKKEHLDGKPLLFALGAEIVGVTYVERTNGAWCFGYHDGDKGYFLASAISLYPPSKEDVKMNPKSTLCATTRWEHRPREDGVQWLTFGKGRQITNIGYNHQDSWVWTGQYKGKWGLFPACFVENLHDAPTRRPAPGRNASGDASPRALGFSAPFRRQVTASTTASG